MIGIIGAMDQELSKFTELVEDKKETTYLNFKFIEGKVKDKKVIIAQTGIGRTASAMATTLLLEKFDIKYLINVGSCGGVDFKDRIGDIILGEKIYYGDVDLTAFNYEYGQMSGCEPYFTCDDDLINEFIHKNQNENIKKGNLLTFDQFVNDSDYLFDIIDRHFANIDFKSVDMEIAAIAHVASIYKKPILAIKAISDIIGSGSQDRDFYKYMDFISDKLAKLLYNLF